MIYVWLKYGKPDPSMLANGTLAGSSPSPPLRVRHGASAVLIGGVAGVLVCAVIYIERSLKIDDPVGAISVHGVCGLWGILSLGLLADGSMGGIGTASTVPCAVLF